MLKNMIKDALRSGHAFLAPSAAHRWMFCPGSAALQLTAPPSKPSRAAEAGTAFHKVLEEAISGKKPKVPNADLDRMLEYVEELRANGYLVMPEVFVAIGKQLGVEDQIISGTADIVAIKSSPRRLIVADAKTGFVRVEAKDNYQLMLYALGLHKAKPAEEIELCIMQPANPAFFDKAIYTADELNAFGDKVQRAIKECLHATMTFMNKESIDNYLFPSTKSCLWCNAKTICSKYNSSGGIDQMEAKELANEFDCPGSIAVTGGVESVTTLDLPKAKVSMPPEAKSFIGLDPDDAYAKALKVKKEADIILTWYRESLEAGLIKSENYALVPMNAGTRIWEKSTDVETIAFLTGLEKEELMTEPQLLSPAEMDKRYGKDIMKLLDGFITRKPAALTVKKV